MFLWERFTSFNEAVLGTLFYTYTRSINSLVNISHVRQQSSNTSCTQANITQASPVKQHQPTPVQNSWHGSICRYPKNWSGCWSFSSADGCNGSSGWTSRQKSSNCESQPAVNTSKSNRIHERDPSSSGWPCLAHCEHCNTSCRLCYLWHF